jgi:hypothetical protein
MEPLSLLGIFANRAIFTANRINGIGANYKPLGILGVVATVATLAR